MWSICALICFVAASQLFKSKSLEDKSKLIHHDFLGIQINEIRHGNKLHREGKPKLIHHNDFWKGMLSFLNRSFLFAPRF